MAVIPAVKWINVQVLVNDVALKEYNADDDELEMKRDDHDRFISRYVEAKTGAEFVVKIMIDEKSQRLPKGGGLTFLLTIDGGLMASISLRRSDFRKGYDLDFAGYRYHANGKPHEKAFKFSQLHIGKFTHLTAQTIAN